MNNTNPEEFIEVASNLLNHQWVFAKTMPEHPHWYTLRKNWIDDPLGKTFEWIVQYMRDNGYSEKFFRTSYMRWRLNEFKYWTMGSPLHETILINRAYVNGHHPYDDVAAVYDEMWSDPTSLYEDKRIITRCDVKGRVLDIGAGTGLLLDHIKPEAYVGIDPSAAMLKRLHKKHPDYADKTIQCSFEDFYMGTFDTIIGLYGVGSYIPPHALQRIPYMLNEGGSAFLMFYLDQYNPVTHIKGNISPKKYPVTKEVLDNLFRDSGVPEMHTKAFEFGNYYAVDILKRVRK